MNTSFKKIITVFTILLCSNINMFAQQNNTLKESKSNISLEIDPVTFGFNGYGIHLRIKPKNNKHLLLGIGAYAMDMPNALVDLNKKNKGKGWDVRLNQGYGFFGEYHLSKVNKKWFVGGQLGLQEYKIENSSIAGNEKFTNGLLMAYGGYTWQLFDTGFYIKPWGGFGITSKFSGTNTLGNSKYDIAPIVIFATLHIGYTF